MDEKGQTYFDENPSEEDRKRYLGEALKQKDTEAIKQVLVEDLRRVADGNIIGHTIANDKEREKLRQYVRENFGKEINFVK